VLQDGIGLLLQARVEVAAEPYALLADAFADVLLQAPERPAGDEQDVLGVYLQKVLVRVLPASLRRNAGHGSLQDL
jgi:hypothetical protein